MNINRTLISNLFMFIVLVTIGMCLSAYLKNENFWDFANYHYYNAWAFLNNRLNYDIAPASLNSFFNPLIELPLYFYIQYFNDNITLIYALQGIWCGLSLFLFYKIYTLFFETKTILQKIGMFFALTLSITGQATFHQIGSSTNEISIACFMLWGIYILLKMIKFQNTQTLINFLFAGFVMGMGLGLKQTVITYCLASGIALIICYKTLNKPIKSIFLFAIGGLIGYLFVNGYFMYKLWNLYSNPLFPFLNGIFHSPYFDDFNFSDRRYTSSAVEFFIYPFLWNSSKYNIAEIPMFNFRLSLIYLIFIICGVYFLIRKKISLSESEKFFSVLLLLCFFAWMIMFSIMRYSVTIEVLSTVLFMKVLAYLAFETRHQYIGAVVASVIVVLLFVPLVDSGWDKRNVNETKFIDMQTIKLPQNTLLKLYNFPSAFVVPILSENTSLRALGYYQYNCTYVKGFDFLEHGKFFDIRKNIEQTHKGPVVIVFINNTFIQDLPIRKMQEVIRNCRKNDNCRVNYCNTHAHTEDLILSIPDGYYCTKLKNNIDDRLQICVPSEIKTQILGE